MATKKSASKKATGTETAAAEKTAPAKKTAAKETAAKTASTQTASPEQPKAAAKIAKSKPTHHDISVQAYLIWEREGKKHGHHDQYWQQAEKELHG